MTISPEDLNLTKCFLNERRQESTMVKELGFGVRRIWVGILALLLADCVTLGK